jgi:predicted transposase YdaD
LSAEENLWLKSLSDELDSLEVTRIGDEIVRQGKDARIEAYLNVITETNAESMKEAMKMGKSKKVTLEQVMIDCGLAAKLEAKGRAEGEAKGAVTIAQNMVNMGLSFETVVSATQLEPEKVKALYK